MQLPLQFKHKDTKTFENFIVGENAILINSLNDFFIGDQSLLYIWGSEKSGKSHLAQAIQTQLINQGISSVLLRSEALKERSQIDLIKLFDFFIIDDIDHACSTRVGEENLFQWINEIKQSYKKLIVTSQVANQNFNFTLADLKSRLQSAQQHQIKSLKRDDLLKVFSKEAGVRGLNINQNVLKFIQNNCPLNLAFLMSLLYQLENITLIKKKTVTIPLIKQILTANLVKQK